MEISNCESKQTISGYNSPRAKILFENPCITDKTCVTQHLFSMIFKHLPFDYRKEGFKCRLNNALAPRT